MLALVAFVQFEKREKHPFRGATFSKVAGFYPTTKLYKRDQMILGIQYLEKCGYINYISLLVLPPSQFIYFLFWQKKNNTLVSGNAGDENNLHLGDRKKKLSI